MKPLPSTANIHFGSETCISVDLHKLTLARPSGDCHPKMFYFLHSAFLMQRYEIWYCCLFNLFVFSKILGICDLWVVRCDVVLEVVTAKMTDFP